MYFTARKQHDDTRNENEWNGWRVTNIRTSSATYVSSLNNYKVSSSSNALTSTDDLHIDLYDKK